MTHLDIIKEAYDKVGILYVVEEWGKGWHYLIMCSDDDKKSHETMGWSLMGGGRKSIEFHDGKVSNYLS